MRCARRLEAHAGSPGHSTGPSQCVAAGATGIRRRGSGRRGSPAQASRAVLHGTGCRRCRRRVSCQGAVTAEFAVALPAVLLLLAFLLAGSAAAVTQLRLEEAARAGARALARGEDVAAAEGIVRRLAGESATSAVDSEGEWLAVTVSARVAGAVGPLVPWTLTARAWARGESADWPAALPGEEPEWRNLGRTA